MNNFSWTKALGFGAIIWLIMFAATSAIVGFGASIGVGWGLVLAVVAGIVSYIFAISTESHNGAQALGYGIVWAILGIALDFVISSQFKSDIFGLWSYWVGYGLVLLAPWVEYEIQGVGAHPQAV